MRHPLSLSRRILIALVLVFSLLLSSCASAADVRKFTDVAADSWYYNAVAYATEHNMVSGTSTTTFSPDAGMTRGQFVTILRRAMGASDNNYKKSSSILFSDVKPGSYYEQPIYWAVTRGIVSGTGYGQFSPDKDLTRQDMAVIIQKALQASALVIPDTVPAKTFRDAREISAYATGAIAELQTKGLLAGDNEGRVQPKKTMTRAEGTTVLVRLVQNVKSAVPATTFVPPSYNGVPSVIVNNNVPEFTAEEKKNATSSFERYSDLDSLGRCQAAVACISKDLMPTEERESITTVHPSGWHLIRYDDLIEDHYLYNRCHMIGFQLTGENANERNLITGTRYMNVEGMLPYENEVAYYIRRTGNHVLYRVTPVFEGDNLLCSGVKMEAYSVEDRGASVSFNVYCFNVQPGVIIDYSDGYSWRDPDYTAPVSDAARSDTGIVPVSGSTEETSRTIPEGTTYVLNTNTKAAHLPGCSSVSRISDRNIAYSTKDLPSLIAEGYHPCGVCLKSEV